MAQGPGEVEDIHSRIEQTRAEMSDTIDAIQARLSPTRAIADVKDTVTDATVGRLKRLAHRTSGSGRSLLDIARDNPLPVALLATASAGLIVRLLNHRNRRRLKTPRTLTDEGWGERRERTNPAPRHNARRLMAAASAGIACWAIWRAQTPASHSRSEYPEAAGVQDRGL